MQNYLTLAELLQQGQWQAVHPQVQDDPSPLGCWLHGIVHIQEGDLENARYWYRRARRDWPAAPSVDVEVAALRQALAVPNADVVKR